MYFIIGLQWALSGNQVVCSGDNILILLKGNHISGNGFVRIREILLDLRLKVNYSGSQAINVNQSSYTTFFNANIKIIGEFMKKQKTSELKNLVEETKKKEKTKKETVNTKWIITIVITSFIISFCLSFIANTTIPNLSLIFGIIITLIFIFIGIIFDIIGVSVTAAEESVFHSMNSRKVKGANVAVKFKKNADKVSSFCCDVIGDICGVISGAAGTTIAAILVTKYNMNVLLVGLLITATISSLTIGGKAIGKSFAINKSDIILYEFAKFISNFYRN